MTIALTCKLAGDCEDNTCPAVHETSHPGQLAVTGVRLGWRSRWATRRARGRGEGTLLIDAALLDQAAEARGYRRP